MEDEQDKSVFDTVFCTITIAEDDMKALIRIRNYFGENDKTQLDHLAYDVLNRVVKPFLKDKTIA